MDRQIKDQESRNVCKTVSNVGTTVSLLGMGIGFLAGCVADDKTLSFAEREKAKQISEASYKVSSEAGKVAGAAMVADFAKKFF